MQRGETKKRCRDLWRHDF